MFFMFISAIVNSCTLSLINTEFGKGLHFVHLNVRSLLAKNRFDMLKAQIVNSNISIFTVSESWLNHKIPSSMIAISQGSLSQGLIDL